MRKTQSFVSRSLMRFGACLAVVLCAAPLCAQQEIVARQRAAYPTPMTAEQKVALLRGVATEVHGGLLVKPDGNTCLGYACDVICFSATALFDVLQAEGEAAIPTWNATGNPRGYACELVATAPVPPPVSPPPLSVDLSAVLATVNARAADLAAKLDALEAEDRSDQQALDAKLDALAAKVDNPNWFQKIVGNRYVQLFATAVGTYLATHQLLK